MRLILVAALVGLFIGLFGTPLLIGFLRRHGYAQAIRDESDGHNYPDHEAKRGTPSMGGLMIVGGTVAGYSVAHLYTWGSPSASGVLVLVLMTGLACVGFADDYIKIFRQRSSGLRASVKLGGQALVAIVFGLLVTRYPGPDGRTPASHAVSFVRDSPWVLPAGLFVVWVFLMVVATSNGVNLADGLDGLATGASTMVLAAYVVIGIWQYGNSCSTNLAPKCYEVRDPLDLAVVAAAGVGACFGFLWWNASPAQIFMGDTGSLALGGLLAGLAILSRTELLLLVLGGLFVVITMSVILQVGSYKLTGRRMFLMAPLQHHFEMKGWGEVTIVIRFWIIAGLCVGLALGLFYAEWYGGGIVGVSGPDWLEDANRTSPWETLRVVVAGVGVSGFAAADGLLRLGAQVTVVDRAADARARERATILDVLGARVLLGPDADSATDLLPGTDLVVTSPGWRPSSPLLAAAADAGIAVWGEVELAWRLRPVEDPAPWLCLTGTNGKTTTVRMLESMLVASGARATAAGNVGLPLVDAVLAEEPYDVLAVELSSFQLHWTRSLRPLASAVLNVAEDHVDWHGSMDAYAADKGRVYANTVAACVYNVADPRTEELVRAADVEEGCRAIGFTLGVPSVGMLGVVEDVLVDRAFIADRDRAAAELGTVADVRPQAPHNVANALAAAALARAYGVSPAAVRAGLRAFVPDPHRIAHVADLDGVSYVDDSKATNPHAAAASLEAFASVVWLAGGLAKGASFDDLVQQVSGHLRAVVAFGTDGPAVVAALRRHAPDVPVVEVASVETGLVGADVMTEVVGAAADLAHPGDTVLLAPACASMDQFRDYAERGDLFASVVRARAVA